VTPPLGNATSTRYHGTTFRSPLEARWAVFFDRMGIAWTHEPEEFMVDGQHVVPDFWLPHYGCFWEVRASQTFDQDRYGTWAAIANKPVVVSTRLPHYCSDLTPSRLIVIGFPCAEPMPWPGPAPDMSNPALRERIAEVTGRTWIYSQNRLPAECPDCQRPVLLSFEAETTGAACPVCQWTGFPTKLLARLGAAGDAAEAVTF
jgi:hypothetical protein